MAAPSAPPAAAALTVLLSVGASAPGLLWGGPAARSAAALRPAALRDGEVHRLITYIFVYEDLSSLACGAVIIWYFAGSFEKNVGTVKHCVLTAAFSVLSALLYLFLEPLVSRLLEVGDAKGFMPVAFATLGVSTTRSRMKSTLLFGCRVPVVLVPWLGLCVAWFVPHSSLLGNLCGLLVGEALPLTAMGEASMDPTISAADSTAQQDSLFSMTDVFLISLITGLFTYWFFFRKKKEEVPDLPKMQSVAAPVRDSSFIEKMKKTGRNIVVFYGSQTGTAEEFANRLSKDAHRYGLRGMAADPEEYDLSDLSRLSEIDKSLAVFCMATYGEGDPTDNAQDFYDWLQEADADLSGLRFAVFGLGNKTYEHFNAMGKYVDKRLEELGAQRIFELGLGDDDGNLEEDFITWREQFWPAVCEHFGVEATGEESSIRQYELVVHTDVNMNKVYTGEMGRLKSYENQKPPFDAKNPFLAQVTENRKLNEGGERHLMHLVLDISNSKIRYESGDHVAVYPANDSSLVNQIGEILGTDLDTVMSLNNLDEESNKKHPFPCPTSYRTALTYYLDITNPPRTNVLYELAQYATDAGEQERLRKMASSAPEGKALYLSWVVEARRNILAILQDMPSLHPPIDHLCELLPRLQARYYSIASSSKVHPNSIHICAVTVEYETKTGRLNKGVATNWLKGKVPEQNGSSSLVPMYVRKSQFRLPFKPSTPVIMIGPGTGIAPFIGFIQERAWLKQQGKEVGETVLYYGCRHEREDYLYREELARFQKEGVLTQLNVAFSRDQAEKVYVQHLLKKNKENVWKLINEGMAHIYVCGDARNMARDVQNTFYEIVSEFGNMSQPQAVDYVKKLMTKGRYSLDVWS
ncbi:NADPH--cytochrome P450 reductase [Turdus rufiventris]|nr:NADPH--cytochrome P450 reductase [Turdus rufiventris]